jgi:hypothetical protein
VSKASEFLNRFDAGGRFRESDGSLDVVFLTNKGGKYPGKLEFRDGFCVRADMEGAESWSYPDGTPLDGLRFLLKFDGEEPLVVYVRQGRIMTADSLREVPLSPQEVSQALARRGIQTHPRARAALLSLDKKEQEAVIEAVTRLASKPLDQWPPDLAPRLAKDKPVYLLAVSSELRAFVRVADTGTVELFDIVREATLRTFLEQAKAGSGAK